MSYNPYDPTARSVPGVQVVVISKEDAGTVIHGYASLRCKTTGG